MEDRWFPGPRLAPLPRRLQLPRRQAGRGRPAVPGRRSTRVQNAVGVLQDIASIFGLPRTARSTERADRSRHQHGRLRVPPGIPAARKLLGASVHRAGGDVSVHLQAFRLGPHPVHRLLVRAVEGSVIRHQDPNRHRRRTSTSATTGPHAAPMTATRRERGPVRIRETPRPPCRRSRAEVRSV